uniref:Titin n=1 Tax=Oncorhynchus kisutch TaxID=8019 RepID=A0A8C7I2U2_ONCKI
MGENVTRLRITEYVVSDLKAGGNYYFRVRAINTEGVGEPAVVEEIVELKDRETLPDYELDAEYRRTLVVRVRGSIRIFVPIKGRPVPEVTWMKDNAILGKGGREHIDTTESYTLLVIPDCTRYDAGKYMLSLENVAGKRDGFVNVRVLDSPGPPVNLIPREITKTSITMQWEIPIIDGGSKIINYVIEKREATRKAYTVITTTWQKCSFKFDNLDEGSEYYFRVSAENDLGVGEPAETPETIRASQAPTAPENLYVTDVSVDTASLAWTKPKHDGGSRITGYVIEAQKKDTETWTHVTTTTFTVSGLTEDATYEFHVMARNSAGGLSKPSLPSEEITCRDDVEEPKLEVDTIYNSTVVVKAGDVFKLAASVTGRPIPTLVWTKDGKELEDTAKLEIKLYDFSTTLVNKDSLRRCGGTFTLTASNPGGFAKHTFNVKILDRPGPPDGPLAVTDVTAEKCILSWLPPSHDGGAKILHYIIEKRETSRLAWTNVATDLQVNRFKVTKLLKGNEYIFRVMAVNMYGTGEPLESDPMVSTNPYVPADAPSTPEVTTITKNTMVVCWERPDHDGGSDIFNYVVERRDKTGLRWVKCNKRTVTDLRFKVSGLTPGHEYEFRIIAENNAGLGTPSPSSEFYKAVDTIFQPGPPGNQRVLDTTKSSITVAWNKPVYDGEDRLLPPDID